MQKWGDFAKQLRETGEYRTPDDFKPSVIDRLMGRFDWWYHASISWTVWSCGVLGKRGRLDDPAWGQKCLDVMQAVERCGSRVDISIPAAARACSPCVYIGNHMSVLETMVLPAILLPFNHPTIVVKEQLLHYPGLCNVLRAVDPIAVTRTDPRKDLKMVLTQGAESLARGRSVLVFPQSTRNPVFTPKEFNSLGAKLAARANVPVVPLALKTDFSGIGRVVKEFGRIDRSKTVYFHFGEPLDAAADSKRAHADTVDFIASAVRRWGGTVAGTEPQSIEP